MTLESHVHPAYSRDYFFVCSPAFLEERAKIDHMHVIMQRRKQKTDAKQPLKLFPSYKMNNCCIWSYILCTSDLTKYDFIIWTPLSDFI